MGRTNDILSPGEYAVLSSLIKKRRKGRTWGELLKETGLSKSGLSKVLTRLKNYGFIEETLLEREGRKIKGYIARVSSINDARISKLLLDMLSYIDEIGSKNKITEKEIKEIDETIEDVLLIVVKDSLYKLLTYKRKNIVDEIVKDLTEILLKIKDKLEKYPHIRENLL